MQIQQRIPVMHNGSRRAMKSWFKKMYQADLLYHPDDPANTIFNLKSGELTFTPEECVQLDLTVNAMFRHHGQKVYDAAITYAYKSLGIVPIDATN